MEERPATDPKSTASAGIKSGGEVRPEAGRSVGSEGKRPKPTGRWRAILAVFALVFLAGFAPMWIKAERTADERDAARREARALRLESVSARAAMDARRGEYESARQAASQFFTELNAEMELGKGSLLSPAQRAGLQALVGRRDEMITFLARSDPASAERMAEIYLACREALNGS